MVANDNYLSEWRDMVTLPPEYEDAFLAWDGIGICIAHISERGRVVCTAPDGDTMMAHEEGFTLWRPLPASPPEESSENELLAQIAALGTNNHTAPSRRAAELADKYIALDAITFGLAVASVDSDIAKRVLDDVKCLAAAIRKSVA